VQAEKLTWLCENGKTHGLTSPVEFSLTTQDDVKEFGTLCGNPLLNIDLNIKKQTNTIILFDIFFSYVTYSQCFDAHTKIFT
jgi:hypothetical protein